MKIIIDPQWTFTEALKAAWEAYPAGLEHGVPNRIRVLEQWANVVGRQRATSGFESTLSEYEDLEEASRRLALSLYTIRKLKKSFEAMPVVTPFASESSSFYELLKHLSEEEIDTKNPAILNQFLELSQRAGINLLCKIIDSLTQGDIAPAINENTLQQFLEISQKAGVDVIPRLVHWITTTAKAEDIVNVLEKLEVDELQKLNAAVELSNLKSVISTWQDNKENDNEEFWQGVLAQNSFMFAQLFSFPVIVLEDKAYVGGKNINNRGGNIIDFLCANNFTRNVALVEIKTPVTKLIGSKYRSDIYNISNEVSGSVIQVSNYKNSLLQNYATLINSEENRFEAFDPKCIVIIGNIHTELTEQKQRKSFELFRMGLNNVRIITYDELFGKVEFLVNLLEGNVTE